MRFCVLSDSHGDTAAMDRLLKDLRARELSVDAFIHAGDYAADTNYLSAETGLPIYAVWGNSDPYKQRHYHKPDEFIELADKMIWLTHGHRYLQTAHDLQELHEQAQVYVVDIVVYGHTHRPAIDNIDEILFLNPGSISMPRMSKPSYAILEVTSENIHTAIYEID